MQIIDAKTTYFDSDGNPLSGGRLRFYVYETTTPVVVYADPDYVTPLGTEVTLTSSGWTATGLNANQSITVHVDKYLGMDEYGQDIYEEVKVYDYVVGISGASSTDTAVDTLDDLRNVSPVDGLAVTVKGYYEVGDCPVRTFIYEEDNTAIDNSGTIIESIITPIGRWILTIEGPYVDCRIFGVMPSTEAIYANSNLASLFAYCINTNKTAYFITGNYILVSGGSIVADCPIKVDKNALINVSSGTYIITITNPNLDIANTFAGTGLKIILNGEGWNNTTVPLTAWNKISKGYDQGNAKFNLFVNATDYTWADDTEYNDIIIDDSTYTLNFLTHRVDANELKGKGAINLSAEANLSFNTLRTSNLTGLISKATSLTKKHLIVDSDITLGTSATPSWSNNYDPRMTVQGSITAYEIVTVPKRFTCVRNALSGSIFNFGNSPLDVYWFSSNHCLVNSINASSFEYLDLQGITLVTSLGRGLSLRNGTVHQLIENCTLYNVTVTDRYLGDYVDATDCIFQDSMPNLTSSKMHRVNIQGTTLNFGVINGQNSVWNEVTITRQVKVLGGSARWTNVMAGEVILIPNNDFGNFMWYGGSASEIVFDAATKSSTVDSKCYNTHIQNIINLFYGITATNGTTKKWAFSGHYNVRIGNNEAGRATFGTKSFTVTSISSGVTTALEDKVLLFNTGGTNEFVNTSTAYAQFYSTTGEAKGYELFAANSPIRYSDTKKLFQLYRGDNYLTNPSVGDKLWITFEVYK